MKTLSVLRLTFHAPQIRQALLGALTTALALSSGAAQAALEGRDLDGNSVIDAYYDTDLNITWLRNANVNGATTWSAAVTWAANYSFGGYSDWRLPTSDTCNGYNCTGSEMGHLWYVEQGNGAGSAPNFGSFQNVQGNFSGSGYWSGTVNPGNPTDALFFYENTGLQSSGDHANRFYSMAVRDGDIASIPSAVPEPETYALMLAGLAVMRLLGKKKARQPART